MSLLSVYYKRACIKLEFTCLGLSEILLEDLHFSSLSLDLCFSGAALDLQTH